MIIRLNLISPGHKKELSLLRVYFLLKTFILGILWITLMISIILSVARLTLHINFINVVEETSKVVKINNEISKKVKYINNIIAESNQITNEFVAWSEVLLPLGGFISENNKLTEISINQENSRITIRGNSKSPEDFLVMKNQIVKNDLLTNFSFPSNILFQTANFNWTIEAEINTNKL